MKQNNSSLTFCFLPQNCFSLTLMYKIEISWINIPANETFSSITGHKGMLSSRLQLKVCDSLRQALASCRWVVVCLWQKLPRKMTTRDCDLGLILQVGDYWFEPENTFSTIKHQKTKDGRQRDGGLWQEKNVLISNGPMKNHHVCSMKFKVIWSVHYLKRAENHGYLHVSFWDMILSKYITVAILFQKTINNAVIDRHYKECNQTPVMDLMIL